VDCPKKARLLSEVSNVCLLLTTPRVAASDFEGEDNGVLSVHSQKRKRLGRCENSQDRAQQWDLVNTIMNLPVLQSGGNFLIR
jgi:hypothetical protein